ncbi:MAG: cobalt ABC transporter ATP-binding protein [Proteobacteria bacterium]|nr:MAG: cobalt ABC transporter ATP-binding protein [Pseudomonadota bacterium]
MSCSVGLKNLTIKRDDKILHENINLNISHKEKIGIIGTNGSGKTTLLETIAGLHYPIIGSLELFHNKIQNPKEYEKYRHLIGYLCQNSDEQFLSPNVQDDIAFSLLARGIDKKEATIKANWIMDELNISHLKDKIVYNLSGGEKKLVALAGVLVYEPKIMLLDEPTNDLDQKMQKKLKNILNNIDKSFIIVSHDKNFIKQVTHKIYKLDKKGLNPTN